MGEIKKTEKRRKGQVNEEAEDQRERNKMNGRDVEGHKGRSK
jgi:hypothetical protein